MISDPPDEIKLEEMKNTSITLLLPILFWTTVTIHSEKVHSLVPRSRPLRAPASWKPKGHCCPMIDEGAKEILKDECDKDPGMAGD